MTYGRAVATCLTSKYFTFSGRASRSEYWWWNLFVLVSVSVIPLLFAGIEMVLVDSGISGTALVIVQAITVWVPFFLMFVLLFPSWAVAARRAHDSGHSGWLILVPIYNIILPFLPSDPNKNKYGKLNA